MAMMQRPKLGVDNGEGLFANAVKAGGTANRVMKSSPKMESLVGPQFDSPVLPGISNRTSTPSNPEQSIKSFPNPLDTLTQGARKPLGGLQDTRLARPVEKTDLEQLIETLTANAKAGYEFDPNGPEAQMIEQIFSSQLGAIGNARSAANTRFGEATDATRNLYSGHEQQVRTIDQKQFENIGNAGVARTGAVYDDVIGQAQNSQNANRAENEEMLQRLGLQASAPVAAETANAQQGHIDGLTQMKAAGQARGTEYMNSDLSSNISRANSIADESVTKQTELRRQLEGILGDLGNKEAELASQKAQALFSAQQRGQQNWREDRQYATDSLAQIMEAQGKASASSDSGTNPLALMNVMNAVGIQDPREQQKYSNAYTEAILKSGYSPGMDDPVSVYGNYMLKKYPDLDQNAIVAMVQSMNNFGTWKPGAPAS